MVDSSNSVPSTPEASAPASPTSSPARHRVYYFENDQVIFLVEDTLFNVHKSLFTRHSSVFRDMFDVPPTAGECLEGTSDLHPIRLEGIAALDFERLLSILYPPVIGEHTATLDEWTSILQLSTRWLFDDIRSLAIRELTKLNIDPVQKIAIALENDVPEWLHTSYMALCERPAPLSVTEARRLGVEVVAQLARARECFRDQKHNHECFRDQRHGRDVDLCKIVSREFGLPLPDDRPPALVLPWSQS